MSEAGSAHEEQLLREGLAAIGGRGAGWIARFLPTDIHELQLHHPSPIGSIGALVADDLSATGRVVGHEEFADGSRVMRALVGSGGMNLNPTVITVWATPSVEGGCHVRIRAAAKEGLIKQHAARKAVEGFGARLRAPSD